MLSSRLATRPSSFRPSTASLKTRGMSSSKWPTARTLSGRVQQLGEERLALQELQPRDVDAVRHHQVEYGIADGIAPLKPAPPARALLEAPEVGAADGIENADLAVRHVGAAAKCSQRLGDLREPARCIGAVAGAQPALTVPEYRRQPVAVVLDLEDPAGHGQGQRPLVEQHGREFVKGHPLDGDPATGVFLSAKCAESDHDRPQNPSR
jgi:hypothetical protein